MGLFAIKGQYNKEVGFQIIYLKNEKPPAAVCQSVVFITFAC